MEGSASLLTPARRYFIVTALRWLPVGLIAPLTVLYMQSRGVTLGGVGVVMAVYSTAVLLLELPTGGLADAVGRRPTLIAAGAIGVAAHATLLVAEGVAGFALAWVLVGVDRALDSGALESWYVDEERRHDPQRAIRGGLAGASVATALSIAAGSLAGGLLPRFAPEAWTSVYSPLALPFLVAAIVHAIRVIATLILIHEERPRGLGALRCGLAEVPTTIRRGVELAQRSTAITSLVATVVAAGFAMSAIENLWQPRFAVLAGGVESRTVLFGSLSAAAFLVGALGSVGSPFAAKVFGGRLGRAGFTFEAAMGAVVLGLALTSGLGLAAGLFAGFYVLIGLLEPLHREFLHSLVPSAQRSTMVSMDSLALHVGAIASSLTLPALAHARGIPLAWTIAAVGLMAGGILYLRAERAVGRAEPVLQDV